MTHYACAIVPPLTREVFIVVYFFVGKAFNTWLLTIKGNWDFDFVTAKT